MALSISHNCLYGDCKGFPFCRSRNLPVLGIFERLQKAGYYIPGTLGRHEWGGCSSDGVSKSDRSSNSDNSKKALIFIKQALKLPLNSNNSKTEKVFKRH